MRHTNPLFYVRGLAALAMETEISAALWLWALVAWEGL